MLAKEFINLPRSGFFGVHVAAQHQFTSFHLASLGIMERRVNPDEHCILP
jgi:hypothetical protein